MKKVLFLLLTALAGCSSPKPPIPPAAPESGDAAFNRIAGDYLTGYLAWRPLEAVQLGFHEYDGKLTDYSRASIDGELLRLTEFDHRLGAMDPASLSAQARFDWRNLQAAVRRELFSFQDLEAYTRNPMTYAGALDVSPYIKRNFAPLEDRVRAMTAILNQAPQVMAAGRANLGGTLPGPWVETAIEIGGGSADFLEKDLVQAVKEVQDAALLSQFTAADQRAVWEMRAFVKYLQEEKLPRATGQFALGREKFAKMLREGELIPESPEEILKIGLAELSREQRLFADTAGRIDLWRRPIEVFNEIQRDHPAPEGLITDTRKDLEAIRQFEADHHIKIPGSCAFIEGWAHYSEQMPVDEGYGLAGPSVGDESVEVKEAKNRLAQLDEALLRLCRLCVAIQMHCQGMPVGHAAEFFQDNCYCGGKLAREEAMRGTFDPGYANYALGRLMILKLRADYQAQEGAAYSLEKFHNELLSHGMPPVPLLREVLLKDPRLWDKAL
jgi:uncharacterized protein (DUF885 family)